MTRTTTARIESALTKLGAEHEPPPDWQGRALDQIDSARYTPGPDELTDVEIEEAGDTLQHVLSLRGAALVAEVRRWRALAMNPLALRARARKVERDTARAGGMCATCRTKKPAPRRKNCVTCLEIARKAMRRKRTKSE